jgi:SecD/SecF fusion protein
MEFFNKDTLERFKDILPYMVMVVGLLSALLFIWYFAAETDDRKRKVGTALSIILSVFSLFCIGLGLKLGIDLQGGAAFLVRVQPAEGRQVSQDALRSAQEIIEKRLNPLGTRDVSITPQGNDGLYVEVPGLSDQEIADSKGTIEKVAKLEFRLLSPKNIGPQGGVSFNPPGEPGIEPGFTLMPYTDSKKIRDPKTGAMVKDPAEAERSIFVKNRAEMSGKSVKQAYAALNPGEMNHHINVTLHSEFGDKMSVLTKENIGKPLAIVLDGAVISAPNINGVFGANFQISGGFSETDARELSSQLENPLENPLRVEQSSTTSSAYGKEVIRQGLVSVLVGLLATLIFMMIYYRTSGVIAVIGLVVNLLLLLGAMQIFEFTLTLPGIAGIILTLGMAVDANVLIYERMREEFAQGKSFTAALNGAYDKAFSAIFDGHVTSLLTAVIMMLIATGAIYGFGLSLTIGLMASLFSSLLITRVCFLWLSKFGLKKLTFMSLISNKKLIDFMSMRKLWLTVSTCLVVGSLAVITIKGKKSLGYELRGGVSISLPSSFTEAQINESLKDFSTVSEGQTFDFNSISLQSRKPIGGETYYTIRSGPGTEKAILAELKKDLAGDDKAKADQLAGADVQSMGSSVGGKMLKNSIIAIIAGIIGIFIYLTFRFESSFAVGAIVALIHDVIIAVGVCVLFDKEIGMILVGAFLTIAGYSVNDTIVIFDRVRENLRTQKGELSDILNFSISSTLSRTIITSGVTSLAVVAMYIFGGKSMADFSFAMLVGMVVGTYSTIFVASPVVLWWATKRNLNIRKQILDADAQRLEALSTMEREAPEKPQKPAKA